MIIKENSIKIPLVINENFIGLENKILNNIKEEKDNKTIYDEFIQQVRRIKKIETSKIKVINEIYLIEKKIGFGAFSHVYFGKDMKNNEDVAIKIVII